MRLPGVSAERNASFWKFALSVYLLLCVVFFAVRTLHWQQVNDPAQFHYACFLMDHGFAPYRDLIEMNMPGTYLVHLAVIHTLGAGSLAWRCFDLGLMAVLACAMIVITRPNDWFAGVFSAALFILFHGRDGAGQMGQRDLIIAVLLLCAYAFLFHAMRTFRAWPMFGFGLVSGYSATIKPTPLPFVLLLLVLMSIYLRKHGRRPWSYVLWALAGMVVPFTIVLAFLVRKHVLGNFVRILRVTLPYYAGIGRPGYGNLLQLAMTTSLWVLLTLALLIAFKKPGAWTWECKPRGLGVLIGMPRDDEDWSTWEIKMIAVGLAFGMASYWGQGKGMHYHRYPLLAFLLLWIGMEFSAALRGTGFVRVAGLAGVTYGMVLAPLYIHEVPRKDWSPAYVNGLTADLDHLGGSALSGKVLCLSTQAECDTALYRMRLVQSTGLFYDFLIFGPGDKPAIQSARKRFVSQLEGNPPQVIVVNIDLYPLTDGYVKLDKWPFFRQYLDDHYALYADRDYPPGQSGNMAYRIYVRKDDAGVGRSSVAE